MFKENGRKKNVGKLEVSNTIKLKQLKHMTCSKCEGIFAVDTPTFGENRCPSCGGILCDEVIYCK